MAVIRAIHRVAYEIAEELKKLGVTELRFIESEFGVQLAKPEKQDIGDKYDLVHRFAQALYHLIEFIDGENEVCEGEFNGIKIVVEVVI